MCKNAARVVRFFTTSQRGFFKLTYLKGVVAFRWGVGLRLNRLHTPNLLQVNKASQSFSFLLRRRDREESGQGLLLPRSKTLCTNPFVWIKVVVGDFLRGQDKPSLLVVQRRRLLLLLGSFYKALFQNDVWHHSVRNDLHRKQKKKTTVSSSVIYEPHNIQ